MINVERFEHDRNVLPGQVGHEWLDLANRSRAEHDGKILCPGILGEALEWRQAIVGHIPRVVEDEQIRAQFLNRFQIIRERWHQRDAVSLFPQHVFIQVREVVWRINDQNMVVILK